MKINKKTFQDQYSVYFGRLMIHTAINYVEIADIRNDAKRTQNVCRVLAFRPVPYERMIEKACTAVIARSSVGTLT